MIFCYYFFLNIYFDIFLDNLFDISFDIFFLIFFRSHLFGLVRLGRGGVHARADT